MELHDALTDLAGTITDDPHRLASVQARYRRHRRTRVAVTAASTAGVLCAAVVVGALVLSPASSGGRQRNVAVSASPSGGQQRNAATGAVWVDVATSNGVLSTAGAKTAQVICDGGAVPPGGAIRPAASTPPPPNLEPLSPPTWTGTPPPLGVPFSLSGTVTATSSDSLTITALDGASEGSFVFPSVCRPPLAKVGAEAHIAGTRTGSDTYDFAAVAVRIYPHP